MIKSFACIETEKIFLGCYTKKFSPNLHEKALVKLRMLNRARLLNDLRVPPGNKLEQLKGNRKGEYSIRINDQWRICFYWTLEGVTHVKIEDYH